MRAEADAAAGLTLAWSTSGSSQFVFEKSCSIGQGACVELRQTSRAVGGFALCALAPGTRVLAEKPLLTMLLEDVDDADNIIAAASELTVPDRDDFYGLCMHGVENEAEKTALGIWLSNAYPTDEEPEERGAVFRVICRLNHSCSPVSMTLVPLEPLLRCTAALHTHFPRTSHPWLPLLSHLLPLPSLCASVS